MTMAQDELRELLAKRTNTQAQDWFLVYRARHGMLVVLRELCRQRGAGAVITQLLTCCTAVDPIVAAGLRPVYGDVSPETLALDPLALPQTTATHAIVCQHTFGFIDQASTEALRAAAHAQGALLLEDCAHCVGRLATDSQGAPLADVSFHSFGVEKMLPTYFGGAVWVNPELSDHGLREALVAALGSLPVPTGKLARAMRSYRTQIRVLNHLPRPLAHALRGLWTKVGAFEPAIAGREMAGAVAHEPMGMDDWACEQVLGHLRELPQVQGTRVSALEAYRAELEDASGLRVPAAMLKSGQPLLRLAVNLPDDEAADRALAAVNALGLYAVPWYRPLLFPGVSDADAYGYDPALPGLPNTAALARGAVALPCDLTNDQVREVVQTLRQIATAS